MPRPTVLLPGVALACSGFVSSSRRGGTEKSCALIPSQHSAEECIVRGEVP